MGLGTLHKTVVTKHSLFESNLLIFWLPRLLTFLESGLYLPQENCLRAEVSSSFLAYFSGLLLPAS